MSCPSISKPKRTKSPEVPSSAKQKKAEKKLKGHGKDDDLDASEAFALESSPQKEKKSKKRKREAERSLDAYAPENREDSGLKARKKIKRAEEDQSDPTTTSAVIAPAKKRKNKTGFPDPNEDASLSEQSRKCLAYAFLQFHRPSKWKFNKARQNWILRNIWSNEMVPKPHLPLAYEYLAKVRGGVRENLLQSCRTALETPRNEATPSEKANPLDGASDDTESTTIAAPTPSVENTKEIRARELLDLLGPSLTDVLE